MSPPPIALVKIGGRPAPIDDETGDFEDWFSRRLNGPTSCIDTELGQGLTGDIAGFIVMGSPLCLYEPPPFLARAQALVRALLGTGRPGLGVCFGHQLLCDQLGGFVGPHPKGLEIGTVTVDASSAAASDPLFSALPATWSVNESHGDAVLSRPRDATVLGGNAHDPHQALRLGEALWSVQFHPEMGAAEVRGAIRAHSERIRASGRDPEALSAAARDTPHGEALLSRFGELCWGRT